MIKIDPPLFAALVAGVTTVASSHRKSDDIEGDMPELLTMIVNLAICILLLIILVLNWDNDED